MLMLIACCALVAPVAGPLSLHTPTSSLLQQSEGSASTSTEQVDAKDEQPASDASVTDPVSNAITNGVRLLLDRQEGDGKAEWPYEGVYRKGGEIPIGYRVGGSAIVAQALITAPGLADDNERQEALLRTLQFVCQSIENPAMSHDITARYDVRGWGYTYGLDLLLTMKQHGLIPKDMQPSAEVATLFFIEGLKTTAIPELGGWNYSRPRGFNAPSGHAPFMTGPTLLALFKAASMGYPVDEAVIELAIAALERSRTPSGGVVYSGSAGARSRDAVPGAVGRMLVTEIALQAAGHGSPERVRSALDAFLVHWAWLDKRRAQTGTHVPPYGIAPYYFYFAHYYAAQAVELLPRNEQAEYRRLVQERIFTVRLDDGTWNDRVFPRSASYGTAMCMLALTMQDRPAPTPWEKPSSAIALPTTSEPGDAPPERTP